MGGFVTHPVGPLLSNHRAHRRYVRNVPIASDLAGIGQNGGSGKTVSAKMAAASAEKTGQVQRRAVPVRDNISAFQSTGGGVTAGVEPCTRALVGTMTCGAAK